MDYVCILFMSILIMVCYLVVCYGCIKICLMINVMSDVKNYN